MADDGYRLWTLARALGLLGVSDLTSVGTHLLDRLPGLDRLRDLPAVCFVLRQVLQDDTTWAAVTGGHAVVDWRSLELEVSVITAPPFTDPGGLVSLVLLQVETALRDSGNRSER